MAQERSLLGKEHRYFCTLRGLPLEGRSISPRDEVLQIAAS